MSFSSSTSSSTSLIGSTIGWTENYSSSPRVINIRSEPEPEPKPKSVSSVELGSSGQNRKFQCCGDLDEDLRSMFLGIFLIAFSWIAAMTSLILVLVLTGPATFGASYLVCKLVIAISIVIVAILISIVGMYLMMTA